MTGRALNVVYHLNSITMGGMEVHAAALATAVQQLGHRAQVIIPGRPQVDELAELLAAREVPVYRQTLEGDQPPQQLARQWWRMRFLLRRLQPELLHQHRTGPYHGKWAVLAARAAGVRTIVASEHQSAFRLQGLARHANNGADRLLDRVITVSDYDRYLQLRETDRPPDKVVTVYNGIDLAAFAPLAAEELGPRRQELGLPAEGPVIGSVARLDGQKGLGTLLAAMPGLLQDWPGLQLLLVGDGPLREELEAQAAALGIGAQVHFLGYQAEPAAFIPLMDVFVLPSEWESFGITLVEAMACERPLVATRVGGIPEVVDEGRTALLVPPRDVGALVEAIGCYLANAEMRASHGRAGRQRAQRLFSLQAMGERMVALYERVLEERGLVRRG